MNGALIGSCWWTSVGGEEGAGGLGVGTWGRAGGLMVSVRTCNSNCRDEVMKNDRASAGKTRWDLLVGTEELLMARLEVITPEM